MLPLPDLDDRTFKQIAEESKKMIPKFAPQWTDENFHDPGITLIELFAWLAEMQQYYLNRVTVKNELKFLKLMGIHLKEAAPARADVTFKGITKEVFLPEGTRLAAGGQPFETEEPLLLLPARIEKILSFSDADTVDHTSANGYKGVTYFAFGREAKKGNRLYIGFNRALPLGRNLCLTLRLYENYPVPRGRSENSGEEFISSAKVLWKYYGTGQGQQPQGWLPLKVVKDETMQLSGSGRITFQVPTPMEPVKIHPAGDKSRFWLCCTVKEEGYELLPRVDEISLNTISAVQRETLSQVASFSSGGSPGMAFEAGGTLPLFGTCRVQVLTGEGYWRYWKEARDLSSFGPDDFVFVLVRDRDEKKVLIRFGDGKCGAIPPQGRENIRLISYLPSFEKDRLLGSSSGLPNQILQLYNLPVIPGDFMLQVGKKIPGSKEYLWRDWVRVDDFDTSKPGDPHYILKEETGELLFGNNENGLIPVAADYNICMISCRTGGGDRGNIKENEINVIVGQNDELQEITVTNPLPASGGAARETLDDARRRMRLELKKQFRAVTAEDFEEIARSTPGLRVARAKAIPLYEPGMKEYPQMKAPAQVTVVVVPYGESNKPLPGKGFLETVRRHLDRYRLITTEIHIIPPEYVKIMVSADVIVAPYLKFDPGKIIKALDRLFHPLDSPDGSRGWPFGRAVSKGDVYGLINRIDGVEYIKDLWLDAEGEGVRKLRNGDIEIPPHGLVYPGEHDIEVISRSDL